MEEFERRRRREREKHERQQMQSADHEVSLFPAPRRVTHVNDGEDDVSAKLGDFLKAKEFFNSHTVGISASSGHRQPAILQLPHQTSPSLSASVAVGSSNTIAAGSLRQPFVAPSAQNTHHFTNQQPPPPPPPQQQLQHNHQPSRSNATYLKGSDNKLPYNGRGMAPPKLATAPAAQSASIGGNMQPPPTNIIPNGRQTNTSNNAPLLGPPTSTSINGRLTTSQQKLLSAGVNIDTKLKL